MLAYYSRQHGHRHLGMYPIPTLQESEQKAKEAIQMQLLLTGLLNSEYKYEAWTLADTSVELTLHTEPVNCFKKGAYMVTVLFDDDQNNSNVYINWDYIYYLDPDEKWQKTPGMVDENGFYYVDSTGTYNYYFLVEPEANRFGHSGQWTLMFKSTTVSSSSRRQDQVTQRSPAGLPTSSRTGHPVSPDQSSLPTENPQQARSRSPAISEETDGRLRQRATTAPASSTTTPGGGTRRRRRQGEQGSRRGRGGGGGGSAGEGSWPSAAEVGGRHRTVPSSGLGRLERLRAEARDPPILIVSGPANPLKCWRYRLKKHSGLYLCCSTVWKWIDSGLPLSRILIAFASEAQRNLFLKLVILPKGCTVAKGNLESL